MNMPPLALHGAAGRMGRRVAALLGSDLAQALASPTSPHLGADAGTLAGGAPLGVPITARLAESPAVAAVIDFSTPEALRELLPLVSAVRLPLVVATTGLSESDRAAIAEVAGVCPVVVASNTSLVVNLLFELTRLTATTLAGAGFDCEIVERHHRLKKDAPSGTALSFAKIVQEAMSLPHLRHGREGLVGERPMDEVGVHAVRTGDNVGEHTIIFGAPGETLELVHKGTSRDSYARGAILAARFLVGKPAGLYTMADVLGLAGLAQA